MIEQSSVIGSGEAAESLLAAQLGRLIFVGGSPRSGTTLVQRILDCHPEIYGGPEFDFVPSIVDLFQTMRKSIGSGRIDAFLDDASVTFYLDTSGEPLFKRGFRLAAVEAPLRENLAAGLLRLAGWTPDQEIGRASCRERV